MSARDVRFFASARDLGTLLADFEMVEAVEYVRRGRVLGEQVEIFGRAADVPRLGLSRTGDQMRDDAFLVARKGNDWKLAVVGGTSAVDIADNPASICLSPGGEHGSSAIVAGWAAARKDVDDGLPLLRELSNALRRRFRKIKSYWVGADAERRLAAGCRLTTAVASSPKYDLAR